MRHAAGTPVAAYNIPAYSVFAKLPAVKFVNEFDTRPWWSRPRARS